MTDLEKFTDLLFGELQGIVYSPAKGEVWDQRFFNWPEEKIELHDWITTSSIKSDVYLSPVLYKERRAVKNAVKCSHVTWVEFDGDTQIDFRNIPRPSAIVQTSTSTHLHAYWEIEEVDVQTLEDLNRRLTVYLHADSSGWDATQLLRPPGTINHKYDRPIPVNLSHFSQGVSPLGLFDAAPSLNAPQADLKQADLQPVTKLLMTLPLSLKRKIREETPTQGARSSFLAKIALELAEENLNHAQIFSILHHVDQRVRKFADRTDQFERLSSLAEYALIKINQEDQIIVYDLQSILDHAESLEWIIEGWLHTSGFLILTGAPTVGKTQLALQFAVDLTNRQSFLGKRILSKDTSVLILSLEMEVRQIKYVLGFQSNEWPENLNPKKVNVIDENGGMTAFENLIDQYQPNVVIIDSLSELLEEGDNPNEQAKSVMRWIRKIRRRYNCAIVAIHHNRKATEGNKKPNKLSDLYGSFHFARVVETVLCMWDEGQRLELSAIKTRFGPRDKFYIRRNQHLNFERIDDADRKSGSDRQSEKGNPHVPGLSGRHGN